MRRRLSFETLLWINRSEPWLMLFLRFGSRSTRRSCICLRLVVASLWKESLRSCCCSLDAELQCICSLWWFSVCSLHPRCGWSHASGTPAPGSPFVSFFTLNVHLYHAFPAVIPFPSFHVGQIWRDNLLCVAGSRCRRGVTQGAHSMSARVALRSMNGCAFQCVCARVCEHSMCVHRGRVG